MRRPKLFLRTPRNEITESTYLEMPVFRGGTQIGRVRDFEGPAFRTINEANTKKKILANNLFPLDPTHRKIESLERIASLLPAAAFLGFTNVFSPALRAFLLYASKPARGMKTSPRTSRVLG